jgi:hypothetical protein
MTGEGGMGKTHLQNDAVETLNVHVQFGLPRSSNTSMH